MNLSEIHNKLLSLLVRGLGFVLLYQSTGFALEVADSLLGALTGVSSASFNFLYDLGMLAARFGLAAWFVCGAPPLLDMATRGRRSRSHEDPSRRPAPAPDKRG